MLLIRMKPCGKEKRIADQKGSRERCSDPRRERLLASLESYAPYVNQVPVRGITQIAARSNLDALSDKRVGKRRGA